MAFADTVGLVASDPETASIEQIRQVALFAQSLVLPPVHNPVGELRAPVSLPPAQLSIPSSHTPIRIHPRAGHQGDTLISQ